MKYELAVLAAMSRLDSPNTQAIVAATGISERKVQSVVKSLIDDLGLDIQRLRHGRTFSFVIKGWGVFESGQAIQSQLNKVHLNHSDPSLMANYADKHAYYEQVKMDNYKESMRLEGFEHSAELDLAQNREQHRQQLIE